MFKLSRRLLLVWACALPLIGVRAAEPSAPPAFQEGKDYAKLATTVPVATPGQPEVIEFFSYRCPHCYQLEQSAEDWLKRKPSTVTFVRIPIYVGYQPNYESAARAYYAAEALGVLAKIHQPLFKAIQQERRALDTPEELAAFFAEQGVNADDFLKAYKSFQTETQLRRGAQLAQRYGVRGVPAVMVNGQYEIRSRQMFEVVDYLLTQPVTAPQG